MEIDTSGAYSADKVYGQLTSPFIPKNIKINAHTPYDAEEEQASAVSLKDFRTNISKLKYENNGDEYKFGIQEKKEDEAVTSEIKLGVENSQNSTLDSFSASSLSNKDIVNGAIKRGYSYEQAVVIAKAQKAYESSAVVTNDPIGALNERSFQVK